ncbi:MAG TPA: tRNA (N(6)-L-threonylcarbamoyladenosine(37)-C(2))-methylthiotransferase [Nitrososphaeraceae archaeon]|jgi:MiaB-like tRNA modifying enzyme|nr:tRNA (N(6)-L-threonylcarbamoyladenosine(37)-C(2))-methylthiotransferase [Nitrososphaeraceae archaeon]
MPKYNIKNLIKSNQRIGMTESEKMSEKQHNRSDHGSLILNKQNSKDMITSTNNNDGQRRKIWIEAYGCSANIADSEMIAGMLKSNGYDIASHERESAMNLIVTCSVKDATEHKMLHRISTLSETRKPIIVAGCLPKADRDIVDSINPMASLLGPHSITSTIETVNSAFLGKKTVMLEDSIHDKVNIPRMRQNPTVSIVEIASGCMSQCTFCQTKIAKGYLRSYRIGDICRQIENDVIDGCKEIWLTSTDNGCYGKDSGSNLVELLRAIITIKGSYKIRVGMMNPMYIPSMIDDLLKVFSENDKIFKFLHIPIQSGSERILRRMKRGHTVKTFCEVVKIFRETIPEITIATDIIVGFPSETESDFQDTVSVIQKTEPDIVNSSKYSARPRTESAKFSKINSDVVKRRTGHIHNIIKQIALKRNSMWQKWIGDIIIDEYIHSKKDTLIQGRNYAYKPIILSANSGSSNHEVLNEFRCKIGDVVNVSVESFSYYALQGKLN